MKTHLGALSSLRAAWLLLALLSGPSAVAAEEAGFVVLPDSASHFSGLRAERRMSPNCWRHASKSEERLACFANRLRPRAGHPPTFTEQKTSSSTS